MHHFNHFAALALAAALLSGCPETASCGDGQEYSPEMGCFAREDGGPADAQVDSGGDAGPCMGDCDLAHCDLDSQRCRECIGDGECNDPESAVCGPGGSCTECNDDAQCARLGLGECHEGACLDCTAENEDTVCGAFVCDPATGSCTEDVQNTTGVCLPCVADSNCVADHRCVPMELAGVPRPGGYCLRDFALGCDRPYTIERMGRTTLSGITGLSFCGIDEAQTTCEAVLAFGARCLSGADTECAPSGATCGTVGGSNNTCSYPCGDPLECPGTRACSAGYCGGPT